VKVKSFLKIHGFSVALALPAYEHDFEFLKGEQNLVAICEDGRRYI
jgi:hypothetical protein